MTVVIGVDPGGRTTGVVVREGDELLDFGLLERGEDERVDVYARRVVDRIDELMGSTQFYRQRRPPIVAVEDVVAPSGFRDGRRQFARPDSLITTSIVLGALIGGCAIPPLLVRPNRNGDAPLQTYPAALVGAREKAGTGRLTHARSAWDIAAAGLSMSRGLR